MIVDRWNLRWPTSHVTGRTFAEARRKATRNYFFLFFFFLIGASLSGGRSLVRRCKENCCGDRKEARPADINRGRGPVADATDELTPVDIKISLLFLTASSQTPRLFFLFSSFTVCHDATPFFYFTRLLPPRVGPPFLLLLPIEFHLVSFSLARFFPRFVKLYTYQSLQATLHAR